MKRDGRLHDGIDIGWNTQIPYVIASRNGTVTAIEDGHADYDGQGYGNYVIVDHGDGFEVLYGHLASGSLKVKVGDSVTYGQVLGTMGASGSSTGPHLHFRMHLNGESVDPLLYLDPNNPRPMTASGLEGILNMDDFCVHTGKSDKCLVLNKTQMQKAINNLDWGSEAKTNLKSALDAFVGIQTKYKVNGVFAMAVTMIESGCGTGWAAIDRSTYNWMSISGSYKGQSYVSNRAWRKYSSFSEATYDFGDLIANSSYYFKDGRYTVKTIAIPYCNEEWGEYVNKFMKDIYKAAGVSLTPTSVGGGGSVVQNAIKIHKYVREKGFSYGYIDGTIPEKFSQAKVIDCAGFASWVLYESGNKTFKSGQEYSFRSTYQSHGLTKVSENNIQPGDILVYSSHVEIAAKVVNGQVTRVYDCGCDEDIWNKGTSDCPESSSPHSPPYEVVLRQPGGSSSSSRSSSSSSKSTNATGAAKKILQVAEEMHTYFEKNGYKYDGAYAQTFEGSKKYKAVVCATYVSWVLQECGYIKDSEHYDDCGTEQDLFRKYKWTEIKVSDGSTNQLKPGDIIIYCYGATRWHTDIYVGQGKKLNTGTDNAISVHYQNFSLSGSQGTYSHYFIYRPPNSGESTSSSQFANLLKKGGYTESQINSKGIKQLVVVQSSGSKANVMYFEKASSGWKQNSSLTCSGYVGREGVGKASEGSERTPKGLHSIGEAFYRGNPPSTGLAKFNTYNTYWIDDPNSSKYNQKYKGDYSKVANSAEDMYGTSVYEYGFVINYNIPATGYARGSAFFFHISSGRATAGCVAVERKYVINYLKVLSKSKNPYILIM